MCVCVCVCVCGCACVGVCLCLGEHMSDMSLRGGKILCERGECVLT